MKATDMKITIKSLDTVFKEVAEALGKMRRGERVHHHELSFADLDTLRSALTPRRIDILRAIRRRSPGSVYQLAKLVKRDLKSVNEDLKKLVELDLVTLTKSKEARKRTKPHVAFDRLNVEIRI